jgi:large subunit ribosomal protein L17
MRHATQSQRLSLPSDQRQALLHGMMKSLVTHGQIRTTLSRAKQAQRLADRLVTLGKNGSVHSRRKAFRVLQDRTLVKRLFADIAPRFTDVSGGYTRVMRLSLRQGDGVERALLAFSRLPAVQPARPTAPKGAPTAPSAPAPKQPQPREQEAAEKPKGLFEGLRTLWTRKKKGSAAA